MKNRDALANLLLKTNDLGVLGRELDVDDISDLADFMDINGVFAVVRCKDCKHRYTNACPVREFALEFRDEEHGYQNINFQIKEITHDCGFCYRGEKRDGGADNANH